MKLVIATSNRGKVDEFSALLHNPALELLSLADFPDMPDIQEDGATFMENALKKARTAQAYTGLSAIADDSGLVVDALNGLPGVMSARFAPTTEARNMKLLCLLRDVPDTHRTARFVCALALVRHDGYEWTATGFCEGIITHEPRGIGGFGYDPLFLYEPIGKTFAELPLEIKNRISHRGKALAAFRKAVMEEGILGSTVFR